MEKNKEIVPLSEENAVTDIIKNSVFELWKVINSLTRLRPTKREHYRVSIFGSARTAAGSFAYEQVKKLSEYLTEKGCDIVTGGGPGLMQAANEGAKKASASQKNVGIRIDLPFEQGINPFVKESYTHETFFSRLHHFALASDAFIIVPGGIGTTLESMMVWQLIQVGHMNKDTPLIFIGKMWEDLLHWSQKHFIANELVNPKDLEIPYFVQTAEDAMTILSKYQEQWLKKK